MKFANRTSFIILAAALVLTLGVSSVRAGKPVPVKAWFDGHPVKVAAVQLPDDYAADVSHVANPLYAFLTPEGFIQDHVFGTAIPGVRGYSPYWAVIVVVVLDEGRDVSTDPFTSEQEILDAEANGEVALIRETGIIVLCPVVGR